MSTVKSIAFNALSEQMLLGRALAHASHPVALLDRGARVAWANQTYKDTIEPVAANATTMCRVCTAIQEALGDEYRALWRKLQAGEHWSGAVRLQKNTEGEAYFDCILSPLPDAQGRPAFYLLLLHDVTAHHQEKIQHAHVAQHDALTGLGNRLRMAAYVDELKTKRQPFAFFYMDLDGFKGVNDKLGHAMGDEVLKGFARLLEDISRETDLAIRLGGDEFVLILQDGREGADALHRIGQRILETAGPAIAAIDTRLEGKVGVSIGCARSLYHGATPEDLLNAADEALYRAKKAGKGCFVMAASPADGN